MEGVKGSTQEKILASQFITRFFKHFPSLSEQAVECLFDLCEDEDVSVGILFFYFSNYHHHVFIH